MDNTTQNNKNDEQEINVSNNQENKKDDSIKNDGSGNNNNNNNDLDNSIPNPLFKFNFVSMQDLEILSGTLDNFVFLNPFLPPEKMDEALARRFKIETINKQKQEEEKEKQAKNQDEKVKNDDEEYKILSYVLPSRLYEINKPAFLIPDVSNETRSSSKPNYVNLVEWKLNDQDVQSLDVVFLNNASITNYDSTNGSLNPLNTETSQDAINMILNEIHRRYWIISVNYQNDSSGKYVYYLMKRPLFKEKKMLPSSLEEYDSWFSRQSLKDQEVDWYEPVQEWTSTHQWKLLTPSVIREIIDQDFNDKTNFYVYSYFNLMLETLTKQAQEENNNRGATGINRSYYKEEALKYFTDPNIVNKKIQELREKKESNTISYQESELLSLLLWIAFVLNLDKQSIDSKDLENICDALKGLKSNEHFWYKDLNGLYSQFCFKTFNHQEICKRIWLHQELLAEQNKDTSNKDSQDRYLLEQNRTKTLLDSLKELLKSIKIKTLNKIKPQKNKEENKQENKEKDTTQQDNKEKEPKSKEVIYLESILQKDIKVANKDISGLTDDVYDLYVVSLLDELLKEDVLYGQGIKKPLPKSLLKRLSEIIAQSINQDEIKKVDDVYDGLINNFIYLMVTSYLYEPNKDLISAYRDVFFLKDDRAKVSKSLDRFYSEFIVQALCVLKQRMKLKKFKVVSSAFYYDYLASLSVQDLEQLDYIYTRHSYKSLSKWMLPESNVHLSVFELYKQKEYNTHFRIDGNETTTNKRISHLLQEQSWLKKLSSIRVNVLKDIITLKQHTDAKKHYVIFDQSSMKFYGTYEDIKDGLDANHHLAFRLSFLPRLLDESNSIVTFFDPSLNLNLLNLHLRLNSDNQVHYKSSLFNGIDTKVLNDKHYYLLRSRYHKNSKKQYIKNASNEIVNWNTKDTVWFGYLYLSYLFLNMANQSITPFLIKGLNEEDFKVRDEKAQEVKEVKANVHHLTSSIDNITQDDNFIDYGKDEQKQTTNKQESTEDEYHIPQWDYTKENTVNLIARIGAYAMFNAKLESYVILFVGDGGEGKSTYKNVLAQGLGFGNVYEPSQEILDSANQFSGQAKLGRLVFFRDDNGNERLIEAIDDTKSITSMESRINVERKNENGQTSWPSFLKPFIFANDIPPQLVDDPAFNRRLISIKPASKQELIAKGLLQTNLYTQDDKLLTNTKDLILQVSLNTYINNFFELQRENENISVKKLIDNNTSTNNVKVKYGMNDREKYLLEIIVKYIRQVRKTEKQDGINGGRDCIKILATGQYYYWLSINTQALYDDFGEWWSKRNAEQLKGHFTYNFFEKNFKQNLQKDLWANRFQVRLIEDMRIFKDELDDNNDYDTSSKLEILVPLDKESDIFDFARRLGTTSNLNQTDGPLLEFYTKDPSVLNVDQSKYKILKSKLARQKQQQEQEDIMHHNTQRMNNTNQNTDDIQNDEYVEYDGVDDYGYEDYGY